MLAASRQGTGLVQRWLPLHFNDERYRMIQLTTADKTKDQRLWVAGWKLWLGWWFYLAKEGEHHGSGQLTRSNSRVVNLHNTRILQRRDRRRSGVLFREAQPARPSVRTTKTAGRRSEACQPAARLPSLFRFKDHKVGLNGGGFTTTSPLTTDRISTNFSSLGWPSVDTWRRGHHRPSDLHGARIPNGYCTTCTGQMPGTLLSGYEWHHHGKRFWPRTTTWSLIWKPDGSSIGWTKECAWNKIGHFAKNNFQI